MHCVYTAAQQNVCFCFALLAINIDSLKIEMYLFLFQYNCCELDLWVSSISSSHWTDDGSNLRRRLMRSNWQTKSTSNRLWSFRLLRAAFVCTASKLHNSMTHWNGEFRWKWRKTTYNMSVGEKCRPQLTCCKQNACIAIMLAERARRTGALCFRT